MKFAQQLLNGILHWVITVLISGQKTSKLPPKTENEQRWLRVHRMHCKRALRSLRHSSDSAKIASITSILVNDTALIASLPFDALLIIRLRSIGGPLRPNKPPPFTPAVHPAKVGKAAGFLPLHSAEPDD